MFGIEVYPRFDDPGVKQILALGKILYLNFAQSKRLCHIGTSDAH